MAGKKAVDWETIETDYRAGIKSLRAMATEYGVSHVAIKKRADKDGWVKDLSAKIKAAAEAKVNKAAVNSLVNAERLVSERTVIEANAENQKDIILSHRAEIGRARRLAMSLMDELEEATNNKELFQQVGVLLYAPDENGRDKLNEIYQKVVSLPGRSTVMKQLGETLKIVFGLEREAFGIESKTPMDDALKASGITVSFIAANPQK